MSKCPKGLKSASSWGRGHSSAGGCARANRADQVLLLSIVHQEHQQSTWCFPARRKRESLLRPRPGIREILCNSEQGVRSDFPAQTTETPISRVQPLAWAVQEVWLRNHTGSSQPPAGARDGWKRRSHGSGLALFSKNSLGVTRKGLPHC